MNWLLCYGEYCYLPLVVTAVIIWMFIAWMLKGWKEWKELEKSLEDD